MHLILLVGANPLPNYVVTQALKPTKVTLLYTTETTETMERLKKAIQALEIKNIVPEKIDDAADAGEVRSVIENICKKRSEEQIHLNYTGGTKVMAANAFHEFRSLQFDYKNTLKNLSYFDEKTGNLCLAERTQQNISSGIKFDFKTIVQLHGDGVVRIREKHDDFLKKSNLYAEQFLKDTEDAFAYKPKKESGEPDASPLANGQWLEYWIAQKIEGLGLSPCHVETGITCTRATKREYEVDVVILRGHRLYLLSCTTSDDIRTCKLKLFEAATRARQMGGDLARAAVACFLHGDYRKDSKINLLRQDMADVWDAINTPEAFGLNDLRDWYKGNCDSLKKWLDPEN